MNLNFRNLGTKAKIGAVKLDPQLGDWDLFRRTFGFFQWKRKNNMSDQEIEEFRRGFCGEPEESHAPKP